MTLPCELVGRVEKRRDRDWFTFAAKKGDVLSVDLYADRLGSQGDLYFVLKNPATKQTVVEQDDILLWEFAKKSSKDAALKKKYAQKQSGGGGASDPAAISYTGHMEQLKDFIQAIRTGRQPLVDGEEGRKSVEIILAIYKSAWTGRRVALPLKSDPEVPA